MSMLREMWGKLGGGSPALHGTWSPKKSPVRQDASLSSLYVLDYGSRAHELSLHAGPPTLTLAGWMLTFTDGRWVSSRAGQGCQARPRLRSLRRRVRQLQEENNELRLRVEVLMDMLTDATAQLQGL